MIEISEVKKEYATDSVIGEINLTIPSQAVTSIIGPNGSGKSTLLMTIGRLIDMDGGRIYADGLDVANTKSEDLAKKISILPQENQYTTRLTVRQLVSFGRFPYTHGKLTPEDEDIISTYIDMSGLTPLENRYLDELSGGQKQRAHVAMILCQETDYILLDEPLNNLDVARSVQMMEFLRRACDDLGKTIVIVIHDINFAAKYSDYICTMKSGKVMNFGPIEKMMNCDILSDIFDLDIEVAQGPRGPLAVF